ncbi:MAG: hypothetical protein H6534_05065 [Chthonomonadaceae bacterium]|nr:hypothetical protein [Chthonomonadaceae bacterium]
MIESVDRTAFAEVPQSERQRVIDALSKTKLRNRQVKVQFAHPAFTVQEGDGAKGAKSQKRKKKSR